MIDSDEHAQPIATPASVPASVPPLPDERIVALDARLPPFRVHHLLAWTACSALAMTATRALMTGFGLNPASMTSDEISALQVAFELLFGVGLGTHLFISLAGLAWKRGGVQFFDQPGHWLAVLGAVGQLLIVAIGLIETLGSLELLSASWHIAIAFSFVAVLGVLGCVSIRGALRLPVPWKETVRFAGVSALILSLVIFFASLAAWLLPEPPQLVAFLLIILLLCGLIAMLIAVVGFAVSIATDLERRTRWHWSHWFAVWTLSIQGIGAFVLFMVFITITP